MGPISQVLDMLPGFSSVKGKIRAQDMDEGHLKTLEAIISSMTPRERGHPELIDGSRRRRIARGSGTTSQDVNQLLNQFRQAQKVMRAVASGKRPGDLLRLLR